MRHRHLVIAGSIAAIVVIRHVASSGRTANAADEDVTRNRSAISVRDGHVLGATLRAVRPVDVSLGDLDDAPDPDGDAAEPGEATDADGLTQSERREGEIAELEDRLPAGIGAIEGQVRDQRSDEELPGVTVVVSSPSLGDRTRVAITEEHGYYVIPDLPAGTYTVTFYFADVTVERSGLVVDERMARSVPQRLDTAPVGAVPFTGDSSLENTYVVEGFDTTELTFE